MIFEEKRHIPEQMVTYWNRLRGTRKWPAAQNVRAVDAPEIWDDLFIVRIRVEEGAPKFDYIFQGKNILAASATGYSRCGKG